MTDDSNTPITNVIPVWGLTPDECASIISKVDAFIAAGRVSGIKEKPRRTYICIFDNQGAPYTIIREQRILQLLDPGGSLLMIGKNVDAIMEMLDVCLPEEPVGADKAS